MAEGFFRSKKGYTVVQNEITRDTTISLKAKGLYLVIQAYITMPNKQWTKDDFMRMAKEGQKAFDSAWKELKDNGYLKVHIMPVSGRWHTEYELLDAPDDGPHTLYHNKDGEITSDNVKRAALKEFRDVQEEEAQSDGEKEDESHHYPQNGSNGKTTKYHYPPFGSNGNGSNGNGSNDNGCNGNGGNKKNKDLELKPVNNTFNNNSYLNPNPPDDVETYSMQFIEKHYCANDLIEMGQDVKDVEMVMEILYDYLNTRNPKIWVNREEKSAAVVKSRLMKLNSLDIEYAITKYKSQTTKIHHHKAYMLSILYDAKGQSNLDFTNRVQHDFYGSD